MGEDRKIVDLFCGAGGFSVGFEQENFTIVGGFDINEDAIKTFDANHPDAVGVVSDLTEMEATDIERHTSVEREEIVGVIGGPPCQGFSTANRERDTDDDKNQLVFHFLRLVNELQPAFFVMENVPGILTIGGEEINVPEEVIKTADQYGYTAEYECVNTAEFGVPQKRERVIFIGVRNPCTVLPDSLFPTPTHSSFVTVSEAFEGLPRLEAGEEDTSIPNHRAPNHHDSTVERISKADEGEEIPYDSWSQKTRLHREEPSPTILAGKRANYHRAHPLDDRGLTVRERARLQSFPDWFEFYGSVTEQRKQTGNAIPPKLAKAVASEINKKLDAI